MTESYLPAPYEGMDVSMPAHLLPPTRSPLLQNFLVDGDRVYLRGPMIWKVSASGVLTVGGTSVAGDAWMFPYWTGTHVLFRTFSNVDLPETDRFWPWETFEGSPDDDGTAAIAPDHGRLMLWDPITNVLTNTGAGVFADVDVPSSYGPHITSHNGEIYAITTGDTTAPLFLQYPLASGRYHRRTIIAKLPRNPSELPSGPAPGGGTFLEAPRFCQGLASYAQRLWALGGIPSSPTATADVVAASVITGPTAGTSARLIQPNTLWFTNAVGDIDPLTDLGWRTSGVSNKLVVGLSTTSDYGLGLTPAAKFMVIHKRRTTWVLTGSGTDSFAIKQISATSGLVDPRARLAHDDVVYWVSRDGLMSYDGAEVQNLSEAINPLLRPGIDEVVRPDRSAGAFVQLSALPNNWLLLQTGVNDLYGTAFDTEEVFQSWLYHIPTGRWTQFQTDFYDTPSSPVGTIRGGTAYYHITTQHAFDVTFVTDPLMTTAANRGMDIAPGGFNRNILGRCYFAPMRLAAPMARSQILRYGVETIQEFYDYPNTDNNILWSWLQSYTRRGITGQENAPVGQLIAVEEVDGAVGVSSDTPEFLPALALHERGISVTDVQVRLQRPYADGTDGADNITPFGGAVWVEIVGAFIEWEKTHKRAS